MLTFGLYVYLSTCVCTNTHIISLTIAHPHIHAVCPKWDWLKSKTRHQPAQDLEKFSVLRAVDSSHLSLARTLILCWAGIGKPIAQICTLRPRGAGYTALRCLHKPH